MNIVNRITSLRSLMKSERVDALIIYGTDPHLSEYVLDNWRSIEWISGFTGSYGRVVITHDQALLWTDSRYFLQAQTQLNDTGFVLMKDRQADSISIAGWLKRHLEPGSSVAIDGLTISAGEATKLKEELAVYLKTRHIKDPTIALFHTSNRLSFTPNTLCQHFFWLYKKAGIAGASSHSGRRQFITTLANKGISVRILASLAGHKSIAVTQKYIDVNDDMKRAAVELV